MKHLDLFSGIGGFTLAAKNVWGADYENVGFCDNDEFCQKVLQKNFPNSKIYGDIKQLNGKNITADLITGGFPCQPFSNAGLRKGTEDDRHLWPEMLRIIQEVSPRWVVGENVRGLTNWNGGMVFDQVQTDLEAVGYEVLPFLLPACAVNAPHRRDRIWIVAYLNGNGHGRSYGLAEDSESPSSDERKVERKDRQWIRGIAGGKNKTLADTSILSQGSEQDRNSKGKSEISARNRNSDASNSRREYGKSGSSQRMERKTAEWGGSAEETKRFERNDWNKNWLEVATELCGVDDGLSAELDGFKLSKSAHRQARLKSLGNAIVPQVAEEIFKSMLATPQEGE